MFQAASDALDRGEPFTVLVDARTCSLPSRSHLKAGTAWAKTAWPQVERLVQGMAVLLSGAMMRSTVNMMLQMGKPNQPTLITSREADAFAFARDRCTEARVWNAAAAREAKRAAAAKPAGKATPSTRTAAGAPPPPRQPPRTATRSGSTGDGRDSSPASRGSVGSSRAPTAATPAALFRVGDADSGGTGMSDGGGGGDECGALAVRRGHGDSPDGAAASGDSSGATSAPCLGAIDGIKLEETTVAVRPHAARRNVSPWRRQQPATNQVVPDAWPAATGGDGSGESGGPADAPSRAAQHGSRPSDTVLANAPIGKARWSRRPPAGRCERWMVIRIARRLCGCGRAGRFGTLEDEEEDEEGVVLG